MLSVSSTTSNKEPRRKCRQPFGFGRQIAVCGVAAPRRCFGIDFVAAPCIRLFDAANATRSSFLAAC